MVKRHIGILLTVFSVTMLFAVRTHSQLNVRGNIYREGDTGWIRLTANESDFEMLGKMAGLKRLMMRADPGLGIGFRSVRPMLSRVSLHNIGKLRQLQDIDLSGFQITGDDLGELARNTNLKKVRFIGSGLTDVSAHELSRISSIEELWLDGNKNLTDEALRDFSKLPKLRVLRLYRSSITDVGLAYLKELKNLEELQIGDCQVTDHGVKNLRALYNLRLLDLQGSLISNDALASLRSLENLSWLALSHCNISTEGVSHLKALVNLKWLFLNFTNIADNVAVSLAGMVRLTNLDLTGTKISDRGIGSLKEMKELESLKLALTGVGDAGLSLLDANPRLSYIELFDTNVNKTGLDRLRRNHPNIKIIMTRNF